MDDLGPLTLEERDELRGLIARKAWRSPRYRYLDERARRHATAAWRQQDVFGDQSAPFTKEGS